MLHSELLFQTPYWFLVFCFLAGGLYAVLLYQKVGSWGRNMNYVLAFLRGITVALIVFLLLNPLVKETKSIIERAKIVFAIDNSESVKPYADTSMNVLKSAIKQLQNDGFEVEIQTLNRTIQDLDSIRFDQKSTNLTELLREIQNDNQGQNLSDVFLLSDGIYNEGVSPLNRNFPFKVNVLAVGDTIPATDIRVAEVVHNKVAFLGNDFPIRVNVASVGMEGKTSSIKLMQGGEVLSKQNFSIRAGNDFQTFDFKVNSKEKGIQHYTIEVEGRSGERNLSNNRKDIYIDIIDGRQKILLLAAVPHPDIKAIRALLESNDNYELEVQILTAHPPKISGTKPYDLVIAHQIPNKLELGAGLINDFVKSKTPILFILGNQSKVVSFNAMNKIVTVTQSGNQLDRVVGVFNPAYQQVNLNQEQLALLEKLPPISVPFGDVQVAAGSEPILFQKVGSIKTLKPLLVINTALETKMGVFLGEGLWKWRLEEFELTGKQEVVDNLFQKIVQLLSLKDDKRKFRLFTSNQTYDEGEPVVFRTEVYNAIFERTYGSKIEIALAGEKFKKQEYSFVNEVEEDGYAISNLPTGAYRFDAKTTVSGKTEEISGQFVIQKNEQELLHTTADFGLLREISSKSGGASLNNNGMVAKIKEMQENRPPDKLESSESLMDIIHLKWLFFLLVALLSLEWGTRKYLGEY